MALDIIVQSTHLLPNMFSSPLSNYKSIRLSTKTSSLKHSQNATDGPIPIIHRSTHPDLKRISSQTLASLLYQQADDVLIIDARYPFEYEGGHIRTARNIYTDTDLRSFFVELITSTRRPSIIVFHCEFSSERGPRLCRLFRSLDRQYNIDNYPLLSFPSVYLLDGGYCEFFKQTSCQKFCEPKAYVSMFEESFTQELQIHRHKRKVAHGRVMKIESCDSTGPIPFCMS